MHGLGLMYWPDNWTFVGEFADDERHGRGRCEWKEGAFYDGQWVDGMMGGLGEHGTAAGGSGIWIWKNGNTSEFIKRTKNPHKTSKRTDVVYDAPLDGLKDSDVIDDFLEISLSELGFRVGNPAVFPAANSYQALVITRILLTEAEKRAKAKKEAADRGLPSAPTGNVALAIEDAAGGSGLAKDRARTLKALGKDIKLHSIIIAVNGVKSEDPRELLKLLQTAIRARRYPLTLRLMPPNVDTYMTKSDKGGGTESDAEKMRTPKHRSKPSAVPQAL